MKEVEVKVKGPGSGRESAITALQAAGLNDQVDRRRHAAAAQRLPPAEETPRLERSGLASSADRVSVAIRRNTELFIDYD